MTNVPAKQFLTVVEQQSGVVTTPAFTSVTPSQDGAFDLTVTGDTGRLYLLEGPANLVKWSWLSVRSNSAGSFQFTDASATNHPQRFYRVSVP